MRDQQRADEPGQHRTQRPALWRVPRFAERVSLRDVVDRYRTFAGGFGRAVELRAFGLTPEETFGAEQELAFQGASMKYEGMKWETSGEGRDEVGWER